MTIQLNPTVNDSFETKNLGQLRQAVYDGLGFINPQLSDASQTRTLKDLRTDIKARLGLATPMPFKTDTLVNLRTDIYNMLGFAAMATHAPGVDTLINAFINQSQQFLFRTLELDQGTTAVPAIMAADGDLCVLDRDAILRVALGNAKARWRQADAQIYLAEAKKYVEDLRGRAPPNIDALVNVALQDAQRQFVRRIEINFAPGGSPNVASFVNDTDSTAFDAEPVFLLALANLKASFKQEDAKEIMAQFEKYMKDIVSRQPPNAYTTVNRLLKDAQHYLYRLYDVFRMERWFTWTTIAGVRFYGVNADDGAAISPPTGVTATVGVATTAANLGEARGLAASTFLIDGRILITGGLDTAINGETNSAEIFDPATGGLSTVGAMTVARQKHTATRLLNGQVLIAGGQHGIATALADIFNPATGVFTATGSMLTPRFYHVAQRLQNGKVLITGGLDDSLNLLTSSEIYDPVVGTFSATGATSVSRATAVSAVLPNGKVLVASNFSDSNTAEVYNPTTGIFTATSNTMAVGRDGAVAILMNNGKVLITGGQGGVTSTTEIYDPATNAFSSTGSTTVRRYQPAIRLLPNGKVLLIAGTNTQSGVIVGTTEIYDSTAGTWAAGPSMTTPRFAPTADAIASGLVIVAGGFTTGSISTNSVEIYDPVSNLFRVNGNLTQGTDYYKVYALTATGYTVVGGITTIISPGKTLPSVEASVSAVPAATTVNVSWNPIVNSAITGYVVCRGNTTNTELVLATVDPTVTSYVDTGLLTPSGALPTANTTGNIGNLDARAVTWVGASSGDNTWRELIEGVDPLQYNGTWTGPPQRYEIRQAIELWPTPADATWLLRIKGYFAPLPFNSDADTTSIDWQAVYFKALADALRLYKRPDEANAEDKKLMDYIKRLVAGSHKTARYIPGNIPIRNTPPRPVIV